MTLVVIAQRTFISPSSMWLVDGLCSTQSFRAGSGLGWGEQGIHLRYRIEGSHSVIKRSNILMPYFGKNQN